MSSTGIVLDLRMRDKQGTNVTDYSRYGNDGTVNGDVVWAEQGMRFDGSTGYLGCVNNTSLDITNAITLSAWIKVNNLTDTYSGIISKRSGWGVNAIPYDLHQYENKIRFLIYEASSKVASSPVRLVVGEWAHVVGVYDGANLTSYINCEAGTPIPWVGVLPVTANNVRVGMAGISAIHFNGSIDQAQIYNRALTPLEIKHEYEATKHRYK